MNTAAEACRARPEPTLTGVIVPVGPAEAVVAEHRLRFDVAASWGVPAHVTVLFPFVPPSQVDDDVVARLAAVFAAAAPFDCRFDRCAWFGEDVLWLAPEPDQAFRDLTAAVVEQFPDHPPYGGVFDDVVPHLTVGESRRGTAGELRTVEVEVSRKLPVTARIGHALLIAGTDGPGSWHTVARLPLSAG
ncbi:2'-5' RNA ligase family protein [Nocardioides mesophilus]|uniref:2'-5' RNA ligase family protein n=1 Tax=Nocardioides mesophilus TaxID=433659 RepID=A0A7G9RAB8_9ACTN|nr:2'-5' RNA ligase family protein [Nocardioides mesophilus]QNN52543.1 2'-5' RNA ligase family protein [Nocardioides mesophilus]